MNAHDVVEGLERTGTRGSKLEIARTYAARHRDASGQELVRHLREQGVSEVTVGKAEHLAAGLPIEALMGKPPPKSEAGREGMLVQEIRGLRDDLRGKGEDKQQDAQAQNIGNPAAARAALAAGKK